MTDAREPGSARGILPRARASAMRWPRAALAVAVAALCLALAGSLLERPVPLLVWNASASSPTGLYLVRAGAGARLGDTVVAWAPAGARRLAGQRRYLPPGVPLVKPVAAVAGALVCARGARILVNGRTAAVRRRRDRAGRAMPWWSGCRRLRPGELFLLSAHVAEAFDGRYFGVTRPSEIVGRARLLWAAAGTGANR